MVPLRTNRFVLICLVESPHASGVVHPQPAIFSEAVALHYRQVVRSAPSTTSHQQDTCMWTTSTIQYHGRTAVQVSPLPVILLYEFKVPLIAAEAS